MKILVIGSGGREHALVWKISQSKHAEKIYCAPGNAGISEIAECVDIKAEDFKGLVNFAKANSIGLTVVGPEVPLSNGVVDEFEKQGLKIFGPSKEAAILEGSKAFAKEFMQKNGIPTAKFQTFSDQTGAMHFISTYHSDKIVVKAHGLAAGKGVYVCQGKEDAIIAIEQIMGQRIFGQAGDKVVIEEFLEGEEASFMAFSDGKTVKAMVSSQDHKRIFDNDEGPNTGGMGAYSPAPIVNEKLQKEVMEKIMQPTVDAMKKQGKLYKGVLYAGLMISNGKPKVLEFNCRFGDPETQVVLPRLESDLVEIMLACIEGNLSKTEVKWKKDASSCVVIASKGYPGNYEKGKEIKGLKEANSIPGAIVFHAGTSKSNSDGKILTNGGRVLGVTALGKTIKEAIENAYKAVAKISFDGMHFRKDIGGRALL